MGQTRRIDVPMPFKGVDRSRDHRRQPEGTTVHANNVIPSTIVSSGHRKLSQRPGFELAFNTDLGAKIRMLSVVHQADSSSTSITPGGFQLDQGTGGAVTDPPFSNATWESFGTMPGGILPFSSNRFWGSAANASSTAQEIAVRDVIGLNTASSFTIFIVIWVPIAILTDDHVADYYIYCRLDDTTPDLTGDQGLELKLSLAYTSTGSSGSVTSTIAFSGHLKTYDGAALVETENFTTGNDSGLNTGYTGLVGVLGTFSITVSADNVRATWEGNELLTASGFNINATAHTNLGTNQRYGFGTHMSANTGGFILGAQISHMLAQGQNTSTTTVINAKTEVCAVEAGELFVNDGSDAVFTSVATGMVTDRRLIAAEYQQKLYIMNHEDADQYGSSTELTQVYDPAAGTLADLNQTGYTKGCSICTVYRDALTVGGNTLPNSFHIGPQGNPAATWTVGTNPGSPVVVAIPDILTALITHTDDLLVVGGANSIHVLKGHPNSGGTFDMVSPNIGILSLSAWTHGPEGAIYFLSRDGVYVLNPGESRDPTPLSRPVLPGDLRDINPAQYEISMGYDLENMMIWICATDKQAAGQGIHWVYHLETKSFWPISMFQGTEPYSMFLFQPTEGSQSKLLFGMDGGLVKSPLGSGGDKAASGGSAVIGSQLQFGPFELGSEPGREGILRKLVFVLDGLSSPVNWRVFIGDTAEAAFSTVGTDAFTSGLLDSGGMNLAVYPRARGAYAYVVLSNTSAGSSWSIESLYAEVMNAGIHRVV